jgi:hypothetical protein
VYHGKILDVSPKFLYVDENPTNIRWRYRKLIPFHFEDFDIERVDFVKDETGKVYVAPRFHIKNAWVWCPLCRRKVYFEAWGSVAIDPAKLPDIENGDKQRLRKYALAVALAASASIMRTHVHCHHVDVIHTGDVKVITLRKKMNGKLHLFGNMELHKYVCPYCGRKINGIRKFILHVMHRHLGRKARS